MNDRPSLYPPFVEDTLSGFVRRGVRLARNMAIALGLSGLGAILLGAAVTDGALAQIFVTLFAWAILWIPVLALVIAFTRWLDRRRMPKPVAQPAPDIRNVRLATSWRRLQIAAPAHRDRLLALESSIERSRTHFSGAHLDADSGELCAMIDRRLPDLIEHELDSLPPDQAGRNQSIDNLVDLVEQFARHCWRKRDGLAVDSAYQAEVLRRRFQGRLDEDGVGGG